MVNSNVIPLSNGKSVVLEVLSARVVRINPINDGVEQRGKNGDIIGLNYNDEINYKIGDILDVGKQKFKIRTIYKQLDPANGVGYNAHTHVLSKSSMFIFPLLSMGQQNRNHYRWSQNFCNCFVGTEQGKDYGTYLYLLYRFDASKEFSIFENFLKNHPWFMNSYDPDNYHVMYQFKPDNMAKTDYDLLLDGKYSKISEQAKDKILKFHSSTKDKPLGHILYRSEERKKRLEVDLQAVIPDHKDLYDVFKIEEEIYLEEYKIQSKKPNEFGSTESGFC